MAKFHQKLFYLTANEIAVHVFQCFPPHSHTLDKFILSSAAEQRQAANNSDKRWMIKEPALPKPMECKVVIVVVSSGEENIFISRNSITQAFSLFTPVTIQSNFGVCLNGNLMEVLAALSLSISCALSITIQLSACNMNQVFSFPQSILISHANKLRV